MQKLSADLLSVYEKARDKGTLFASLMIILMMASLITAIVQFGERMSPSWNGLYLVIISLLISLEAMATRQRVREMDLRERWIFHISEWVAFGVLLKILFYILHGPEQFLLDLPRWQKNFVEYFFTGEYLFSLAVLLMIWFIVLAYCDEFEDLYNREGDAVWDELGKLQNALHEIRGRIISRVFLLGGLVVILAVLTRLDLPAAVGGQGRGAAYITPVINVLFYFLLALILLSQTQLSLLRTRWLWQRIEISPRLTSNWLKYGFLWFLILVVVIFFLPTRYSIGLLDTLRFAVSYLLNAVSFIMMIFTLPFTICMAILSLFGGNQQSAMQPQTTANFPPAAAAVQPIGWIEFLRSLLFWVIFLGVIFFALRYYFSQNAALWKIIISFPVIRWLSGVWKEMWHWIIGANRQIKVLVQEGVRRIRQRQVHSPVAAVRRILNLAQMSPRERIIHFYLSLLKLGGEQGIERKPSQTPYAYENRLSSTIPEIDPDLHRLTDTFYEARYSQHPIEPTHSEQAASLWDHIKAIMKSWKKPG